MDSRTIFLVAALICAAWYVVATLLIYENLRRRGQKVSFLWLRMMAPWYASRYKAVTRAEDGKVGSLFYHWLISINLTLLFVLLTALLSI